MLVRSVLREYRTWVLDSRNWERYEPRHDDIIIATAPKCGTTWMQQIICSLVFQDGTPRSLPSVSPWIDARFRATASDMHKALSLQTHRRFLKSHLPVDGLPLHDDVRYVHVARDGRDMIMSFHHHLSNFSTSQLAQFDQIGMADPAIGRPMPRVPEDPAEYFRNWISAPAIPTQAKGIQAPSFFELEAGYWAERKRPNFLLVHYNDLHDDLDAEIRRISAFLQIEVDEDIWPSLVHAAEFASMRAAGDTLMPLTKAMFVGGSQCFFNKGTNGRWRGVLTHDDLALYDAKVREKLTPGLAAWLERGRRATGEPRDMAD